MPSQAGSPKKKTQSSNGGRANPLNDNDLAAAIVELLKGPNADLRRRMFEELLSTLNAPLDRLDYKIITAATRELRTAFSVFRPYRQARKVTVFGSARTATADPNYQLAYDFSKAIADHGWMVVTGGGPGIMDAGVQGAGSEHSFGINIKLPFEQLPSNALAENDHLVEMKYFFTRKVLMIKEADAFVSLPGGLGTLDETFELLTLMQTGKTTIAPLVLLDAPGTRYWDQFDEFLCAETISRGLVDKIDRSLYRRATDVPTALDEVTSFYRVFHSTRMVGDQLVIRVHRPIKPVELTSLESRFGQIALDGRFRTIQPTPWERRENDYLDLPRFSLRFDQRSFSTLRLLIDALNQLPLIQP
ncbi:MAG: LOG family protein [Ferrimicrobium sp.]